MELVGFAGNRFICMFNKNEEESILYKIEGCRESNEVRKLFSIPKRRVKTFTSYKGYLICDGFLYDQ